MWSTHVFICGLKDLENEKKKTFNKHLLRKWLWLLVWQIVLTFLRSFFPSCVFTLRPIRSNFLFGYLSADRSFNVYTKNVYPMCFDAENKKRNYGETI